MRRYDDTKIITASFDQCIIIIIIWKSFCLKKFLKKVYLKRFNLFDSCVFMG